MKLQKYSTEYSHVGRLSPRYPVPARLDHSDAINLSAICNASGGICTYSLSLCAMPANACKGWDFTIQAMASPNGATVLPFELRYLFNQEVLSHEYQAKELGQ